MLRALEGLKILDLSMNLPGPYMTWLLAMLGAEVVKIENPAGGDYARVVGRIGKDTTSPLFEAINRNKKSVTLNLKHAKGRKILLDLLTCYDILIEGFRPGTMERMGLGFSTTSGYQPRLIQVSISGYGQEGPYRLRAGHDLNYLALAGVIGITGTKDGQPVIPGVQIADLAGGSLMALAALLAAVIQRDKTGKGQLVDVAMLDGSLSLTTMAYTGVAAGFERPEPGNMLLTGRVPCYGLYRTKDGRYMSLAALESKFWKDFCSATEREDLVDSQFGPPEIIEQVAEIFSRHTQEEWIQLMQDRDACCEPVLDLNEAVNSELVKARHMVTEGVDGTLSLACPLKLSGSPLPADRRAPELGADTSEILSLVGIDSDALALLSTEGVV